MGYTHYWTFKKPESMIYSDTRYQYAVMNISNLVHAYSQEFGHLSGFTAHCEPGVYRGVNFNGAREKGHETFFLRESLKDYFKKESEPFNFCKTARKPYDALVTASLIILKYWLGPEISIQSDGSLDDFSKGKEILKRFFNGKDNRLVKFASEFELDIEDDDIPSLLDIGL